MKIAILSDIHANSEALKGVLCEVKEMDVSQLIIAGDFVGYYYNISKVLELLSGWDYIGIGGNHEAFLSDWIKGRHREFIFKKYGTSIQRCAEELTRKQIDWLINLPEQREFTLNNKTVLLCHGSPWDRDAYIYPDSKKSTIDKIFAENKDIVIYGHTHYPIIHKKDNQIVVNPGSVGQARDNISGACWALWDTKTHAVTLKRTLYSADNTIKQCQEYDPNLTYLQTVLIKN